MTHPSRGPVRRSGSLLAAAVVILLASTATSAKADTQTLTVTADTWARQNAEYNTPHGSQAAMRVRGGSGVDENRAFVAFDLNKLSVPQGSTNVRARLLLRVQRYDYTGQPATAAFVRRVTGTWDEATLTWTRQPVTASVETAVTVGTPAGQDATADVTSLLPAPLTGQLSLRIAEHYAANGRQMIIATREDATGPAARLEVSFTAPSPVAAAYRAQVAQKGAWQNINGSPIWHSGPAPCRQQVRNIKLPGPGSLPPGNGEVKALTDRWSSVPFPCDFTPTAGSPDHEVVLINDQPGADEPDYFEFWQLRDNCRYADGTETVGRVPDPSKTAGVVYCGFMADWGGADAKSDFLALSPLVDTWNHGGSVATNCRSTGGVCWGTRGSGIAISPGVVTARELYDGEITHPVQVTVSWACAAWLGPATRTDGSNTASCIPYGSIIKLPASASCAGYAYVTRLVCEAGKKHGLIAVDQNRDKVSIAFEGYAHPQAWWKPSKGVYNPYATSPYTLKRDCADPATAWAIHDGDGAVVECFADNPDPVVPPRSAPQAAIDRVKALTPPPGPGQLDFFGCDGLQSSNQTVWTYRTIGYPVLPGEWEQDCILGLRWDDLLKRTDWYDAS
jgi:hypothetical protein